MKRCDGVTGILPPLLNLMAESGVKKDIKMSSCVLVSSPSKMNQPSSVDDASLVRSNSRGRSPSVQTFSFVSWNPNSSASLMAPHVTV